jgi:hypothetical protein
MGFGQTSLSGVRRGFMPPQLKTKQKFIQNEYYKSHLERGSKILVHYLLELIQHLLPIDCFNYQRSEKRCQM